MKKIALLVFCFFLFKGYGQNLVPNPSFEIITNCFPSALNTGILPPWDSPTNGSPDADNICMPISSCDVPSNGWGFQYPHSGSGYVGVGFYSPGNGYKEYIQVQLNSPLIANQMYCSSFYVSLGDFCKSAINNFGIYFSSSHTFISTIHELSFVPQINDTSIISDTTNWTLIYGQYLAQGGEQYIIIGNFFNDTLNDTIHTNVTGAFTTNEIYYYFDDINVHCCTCDSLDHTGISEAKVDKDNFNLSPNPNNGQMTLSYHLAQAAELSIYDMQGRRLITYTLPPNNQTLNLNLEELNAGIYYYSLHTHYKQLKTEKLVIVK
ncbi:MAG: T9SS type A sorting domain-containing protein [Bacteroidota bacterium]